MTQANRVEATPTNVVNGVDVEVLGKTVAAVQEDATLGACQFRATNEWVSGANNRSKVTGFYGAKQEIPHKQTFIMVADEPAILAGNDDSANPVEYLLHALASCLTTSIVAHAAVRGVNVEKVSSTLEGDLDLNGFFGLSADTPKGFTDIRVSFEVDAADEDMDTVRSLTSFSPVLNTLVSGVPVNVDVKQV